MKTRRLPSFFDVYTLLLIVLALGYGIYSLKIAEGLMLCEIAFKLIGVCVACEGFYRLCKRFPRLKRFLLMQNRPRKPIDPNIYLLSLTSVAIVLFHFWVAPHILSQFLWPFRWFLFGCAELYVLLQALTLWGGW